MVYLCQHSKTRGGANMAIKCNLKQLILEKSAGNGHRITYAEISEATGLSTTTITKLANNQSALVGISTLDRLCTYFGVGIGALLTHTPDGARPAAEAELQPEPQPA